MVKYKTTSDLNMRVGAGTNHDKILTIPRGGVVTWNGYSFCGDTVEWKLVQYKNQLGFVSAKYLKEVK